MIHIHLVVLVVVRCSSPMQERISWVLQLICSTPRAPWTALPVAAVPSRGGQALSLECNVRPLSSCCTPQQLRPYKIRYRSSLTVRKLYVDIDTTKRKLLIERAKRALLRYNNLVKVRPTHCCARDAMVCTAAIIAHLLAHGHDKAQATATISICYVLKGSKWVKLGLL